MTRIKSKPRHAPPQTIQTSDASTTQLSQENEQRLELELCWCIQQLQTAINSGKLKDKELKDHTKALNTLMSKTAPIIQKRQVMRLAFGDYRKKMAEEEKKFARLNQLKITSAKPSTKSTFIRKALSFSDKNEFKFNFEPLKDNEKQRINENGETSQTNQKTENGFHFVPSDNSFKFNFDIPN